MTLFNGWGWSWPPWRHERNMQEARISAEFQQLVASMKNGHETTLQEACKSLRDARRRVHVRVRLVTDPGVGHAVQDRYRR